MEKGTKRERLQVYLDFELMDRLNYLHQKEGSRSIRTKRRKTFSSFISNILWEHVNERLAIIRGLRDVVWNERDFEE